MYFLLQVFYKFECKEEKWFKLCLLELYFLYLNFLIRQKDQSISKK